MSDVIQVFYILLFSKLEIICIRHIIGVNPMSYIYSFGNASAWLLLLPGNLACNALGLSEANNPELVRMLVNSLAWTMVGVVVVSIVV